MLLDKAILDNTIFIIDDDENILNSLVVFFDLLGFKTQAFSSAVDYLRQLDDTQGCLICDISMPSMTGMELLTELNKGKHLRPTLFITGVSTVQMAVEAIQLGALDYIEKPVSTDALLNKVLDAIEQFTPSLMAVKDYKTLTPKECQVFDLIVEGVVNNDIAKQLYMSVSTVEKHRSSVMKKMKVDSLALLIAKLPKLKPLGLALACNNT
ncbi:response regulator [Candidatus Thioglobus sp.]|nr:response regulator [Candidatus Thioglobus sp.]MDC0920625.1 response regulator [Candidatus Thioglobus sp.]MDC0965478.1 response regulator [Candidatus Thioglobus sp.]